MAKRILGKVAWLAKGAALFWGAVLTLAVVLGVATTALAAVPGDPFRLGRVNTINALTQLVGSVNNPMLRVDNNNAGANATALDLQVQPGKAPMKVNSATRVTNLNADQLDGKDITAWDAEDTIDTTGPLPASGTYTSKGGTLVILASGSGFRANSRLAGMIGMNVIVDGAGQGIADVFTNEVGSHKAFVDELLVLEGLPAGQHTIRLEARRGSLCNTSEESTGDFCTVTNFDDRYAVTVVEIPD